MPLKPWYRVVTPREDLREGKPLDAAEFAIHLGQVRDGAAPRDYQDPKVFFEKTYLTKTMLDLAAQVVRRLNGVTTQTSAIFNLATNFGGGKTHSLTLLYHLCKHGPASHRWLGVAQILAKSGQSQVPAGEAAVFVGTEFDAIAGRGGADGTPMRKTPWGEIAFQLGGAEGFALVAKHDESGTAPGGDVLKKIIPAERPCLILMDELMNFISRNRKSGLADQFYNFLHNLTETVRGRKNVVLAVSIPASEMEMNAQDLEDYNRITKLLDRLGKAMVLAAEAETSEIIRRRLFEWNLDAVSVEGKVILDRDAAATCAEYAQWCVEHRGSIPGWFPVDSGQKSFQDCYPFHPSVLSVFERKWRGVPKFQQTRGILRLLALWVSRAYKEGYEGAHRDELISLGTAPLEESTFRSACFEQLGERNLETAVTTDIAGSPSAHAVRLDQEGSPEIKKGRLHRKVATAIFFESNGGQGKEKREATIPELRLAVGEAGADLGNVDTVLEGLTTACYYLTVERATYRFSLRENLNKRFADRRATIRGPAVTDRLHREIKQVCDKNSHRLALLYFPEKTVQISDRPALTIVVAGLDQTMEQEKETLAYIGGFIRESGASARMFKTAQVWMVADSARVPREEATKLLAWEDIQFEAADLKYDEVQLEQLKDNISRAKRDLKEAIWRTYKHIVHLGRDNELKVTDLGLVTSSAGSPVDLVIGRLQQEGDIEKAVSPNFLVRNWPPALPEWSTKNVRDAFFATPQFPRLLLPEEIRETIARGVTNGVFAYVSKRGDGHYEPFVFEQALSALDVEVSDDTYVIRRDQAEVYRARIKAEAEGKSIPPPSPVPPTPPQGTGKQPVSPDNPSGHQSDFFKKLTWSGDVPPPMWMNFYTKVLSKHAADRNLKLKVSFEASPTAGISKEKIEETKSALRELGLNPNTLNSE
ncbi:MAG TPA: DUF499 domain-containing protein [Lacunisphaera sp.]|nr:DUF499 domain-containing protein [Lacunisphaera sp.]